MMELDRTLVERLHARRVGIDVPDANTVVFRDVPADERFFNKTSTNVLFKRPRRGMGFRVYVDADLEYTGPDEALSRLFARGPRRRGWRTVCLDRGPSGDLQTVAEDVLAALGFEGEQPTLSPRQGQRAGAAGDGMLNAFATDLTALAAGGAEPTLGRDEEINQVVSCMARWGQTRLAAIVGDSGVGKTNLLTAVAARLQQRPGEARILRVDLVAPLAGAPFEAEREDVLARLLGEAARGDGIVLALEHLALALTVPNGPLLLARFLDEGGRAVGTLLPRYAGLLRHQPLARRLHLVALAELTERETVRVLEALRDRLAAHHGLAIEKACTAACVKAARSLAGRLPAKAIALLDAAASRAALAGKPAIPLDDIYFTAERLAESAEIQAG